MLTLHSKNVIVIGATEGIPAEAIVKAAEACSANIIFCTNQFFV